MNLMQKMALVWERVSLVQRALLIAILLTFVVVGGLLTQWARQPDMRTLYSDLSAEEASKITEKISEKDVAYELRNGGTTILVPKQYVYQLRLDMAKEGLPSGEQKGYKLFDNQRISQSPLVENVNLKRALQEELAKSIQMIDGISHARVHIVSSKQTLFTTQAGQTTASVIVRLKPGHSLTGTNVAAITHLVSGSVEGLNTEGVSVINSQGQLLTGESGNSLASSASTVHDYRERVESNLSHKAEQMLTTVLGPGRAIVKVSAVIDMNSINIVKKVFEPKGVISKEEIQESSKPVGGGDESQAVGKETEGTINTEYALGETIETRVELPGKIMSLSVAAFVDLTPPDVNEAEIAAGADVTPIMPLADVEDVIKNAIGLKSTDALKVVNKRFYRPKQSFLEEEPSNWPRYIAIARQSSLGIMAICALIVLKIFSGAKTKVSSASPVPTTHQLAGAKTAGLLPAGAENMDNSMALRGHIAQALQNNPEQVKQLFASWLEETEE